MPTFTESPAVSDVLRAPSNYVLRVKGEGLPSEGIRDGDYIIVTDRTPESGETVLAMLPEDGSTVIRKFFPGGFGHVAYLQSSTGDLIGYLADEVIVRAVVLAVIRKY